MNGNVKSPALAMRLIQFAFVAAAVFFVYFAFKIVGPLPDHASEPLQLAITFLGLYFVYGGFFLRAKIFRRSEKKAQSGPVKVQVKVWMAKGIMSLAYFESSILFGLVLRLLGGSAFLVEALMGAGIAAELLWRPGKPPIKEAGGRLLS
jgi:predicted transporter